LSKFYVPDYKILIPMERKTMAEFKTHEPGTFCYVEMATNDPTASGKFYTALFGWDRNDQDMGEYGIYTQYQLNGKVVAAQYKLNAEQEAQNVPPNWGQYVTVTDADTATARATELGGQVVMGPMDVMDYGRMSVIADPTGAVFCIWEPKSNIGVELRDEPGSMCWNELMTTDTTKAVTFYAGLFGWETETMSMGDQGDYTMFKGGGGQPAGGMMAIQPEMGPIPPNWLVYFAVDDVDNSHDNAVGLGGKAIVPPTDIMEVGRFAVIADPVGAVFGIYKSTKA
jgi:predicted enzyme related to lactoylglutathione lyase